MTGRRLIIWRHGQTTYNAAGIWQGQLDVPLSDVGRDQARRGAAALLAYDIDAIWASDLSRASATAQALAALVDLPITYDQRFREIDAGSWAGLTAAEVSQRDPDLHRLIESGQDGRRGGDGETVAEVTARMRAGVAELLPTLADGQTVVLATHGLAGRSLLTSLAGFSHEQAWFAFRGLSNCHWGSVVEGAHGWRIETWNAGAR